MIPHFRDSFFSQSMRQAFNRAVGVLVSNENELTLRAYLRVTGQL